MKVLSLAFRGKYRTLKTLTNCFHSTKINLNEESKISKTCFPEQIVEIKTCGNLYKKWSYERRFWRVPNGDLTFKVSFVDTLENKVGDQPLALALHGAPGTYDDFHLLIPHLYNQGVRVIAPSFPDFKAYKPGVFRHSSEERAQFLRDFLKAINVSKVDLLICHSSSVYAGLILCLDRDELHIKSMAMLNPGAHTFMRATRPYLLMSSMVRASEFSLFLKFLEYFGVFILKKIAKSPVRVASYEDPLLSATVMTHASIPKAKDRLLALASQKFPFLFAFSEDDKLIDKELSYQMSNLIGVQNSDICYINKDGIILNKGSEKPNLKVIAFENGSHYVFWKYPEIINEAVSQFLSNNMKNEMV